MAIMYLNFPLTDGSRICVQRNEDLLHMPNMRADGAVPEHAHEFYEMVLIVRNSCRHIYQQDETTLLSGDIFMIPPHRSHSLHFTEDVTYYNCQFFIDAISGEWLDDVNLLTYDRIKEHSGGNSESYGIDRQGILHLNEDEMAEAAQILNQILIEQKHPHNDSERMKRTLLYLLLARLKRVREQKNIMEATDAGWKQQMIREILIEFEKNPSREYAVEDLAAQYHISESYFRSVFRDTTGMPPRQFLNQMRINYAVDLIQHQGLSLKDASGAIGIHDLNYFSRLCKQITGYTPSHFRQHL